MKKKPIKAYRNEEFLASSAGRELRILAEYLEPRDRFRRHKVSDTIVIFGSARLMPQNEADAALAEARHAGLGVVQAEQAAHMAQYYELTRELAHRLTRWSLELNETIEGGEKRRFVICSGGGPGVMEAANRGAAEAGGETIGLNISLPHEQTPNPYISDDLNFDFHYFFMRKFWFAYLAKAIVMMPGGFGTMDEFFEILTLMQTGKMKKKVPILLFGKSYWDQVVNFQKLVDFGAISAEELDLFLMTDSIDEGFAYITEGLLKYALAKPGGIL